MTSFGTIIADPPWNYSRTSSNPKLSGYCDKEYSLLTTEDLIDLPVGKVGSDESVLLLWCTWPFIPDALRVMEAWGYSYVTGLTWVKTMENVENLSYGVGYWFRGATELVLLGKRNKSYRTNWLGFGVDGLVSPRLNHSRKPDSLYQVAESFPGPYLELFARRQREGWHSLGNECPGDYMDIRESLPVLVANPDFWSRHLLQEAVA